MIISRSTFLMQTTFNHDFCTFFLFSLHYCMYYLPCLRLVYIKKWMQDEGSFRYFHHNYHLGEYLGFKISIVYQIVDAYKYIYYMLHAKRETCSIRALSSNKAMKKMKLNLKKNCKTFSIFWGKKWCLCSKFKISNS